MAKSEELGLKAPNGEMADGERRRVLDVKSGKQVLHNFHKIFHKQLEKWKKSYAMQLETEAREVRKESKANSER